MKSGKRAKNLKNLKRIIIDWWRVFFSSFFSSFFSTANLLFGYEYRDNLIREKEEIEKNANSKLK